MNPIIRRRPIRPRGGLRISSAFFAALLLAGGLSSLEAQGPPSPVRVLPVTKGVVEDRVLVTGDLRASLHSQVAAQEAGLVIELPVREGQQVKKGDLLARLDPARLELEQASIVAARAATAAEKEQRLAELEIRSRDVDTLQELAKKQVSNPKELADAQSEMKIAAAQLSRVNAALSELDARLALLARRLGDLEIRAPFAGIVIDRRIEVGEWLAEGAAALELVSVGSVEAWLNVPEELRAAVVAQSRTDTVFEVRIDAVDRSFRARNLRPIPTVDATSRNFSLLVTIDDPDGLLVAGMSANAYVSTGRGGEQLLVHKDAILRGTTGPYIFIAQAMDPSAPPSALPVPVRVLFPSGDHVAVSAAMLAPGALAIVEGNERLFPMMPVAPSPVEGGEPPQHGPGSEGDTP